MTSLKKVSYNSFLYTLSTLLLRASSLFLFPILSSYLTDKDYGIISVVQSITGFTAVIAGLGLTNSLTREIHQKHNLLNENQIISTSLILSFISNLFLTTIILLFGNVILKPILNDIPANPYLLIGACSLPFMAIVDVFRNYLKAIQNGLQAFILDFSFYGLIIGFNLLFIVNFKMKAEAILISSTIISILFSFFLLVLFRKKITFKIPVATIKSMLSYSLPLMPFFILNIFFDSIDKLMLNSFHGSSISGIYYLAITFSSLFSSFKEGLLNAFAPFAYSKFSKDANPRKEIITIVCLGCLGAFFVSLFSKEIITILSNNPDFIVANKYIPLIIISLLIVFLGQIINIKTLFFGNYSKYLFIATFIGMIVDLGLCYFLVPKGSIFGAIISRTCGFLIQTFIFIYFSLKEIKGKDTFNYKLISLLTLITTFFILCVGKFDDMNFSLLHSIFIKISVAIIISLSIIPFINKIKIILTSKNE